MDYYLLTDMAAQIGYELAAAGAEQLAADLNELKAILLQV